MRLIASGRLDPSLFATHRFALEDTMAAYDVFADPPKGRPESGPAAGDYKRKRVRGGRGKAQATA